MCRSKHYCALCDEQVDEDAYCVGCKRFVCQYHATIFGNHKLDDHRAEVK